MEELIAKKYIKALRVNSDIEFMESVTTVFSTLATFFADAKFNAIVNNPHVSTKEKESILLDAVKSANSQKINNLVKILVENKRISVIPAMAVELQKEMAKLTRTFSGVVSSNALVEDSLLQSLSAGLSTKYGATISLQSLQNDFNGIKVEVEGLGVEISFSKDRIQNQIIDHIIKAI